MLGKNVLNLLQVNIILCQEIMILIIVCYVHGYVMGNAFSMVCFYFTFSFGAWCGRARTREAYGDLHQVSWHPLNQKFGL